ncbi:MAG: hypothetical protein HY731_12935 [Candidatus Tectomicrobia bacterium]|nr:hypothetical protein [Candidatus Tectomicrobia bacterium]
MRKITAISFILILLTSCATISTVVPDVSPGLIIATYPRELEGNRVALLVTDQRANREKSLSVVRTIERGVKAAITGVELTPAKSVDEAKARADLLLQVDVLTFETKWYQASWHGNVALKASVTRLSTGQALGGFEVSNEYTLLGLKIMAMAERSVQRALDESIRDFSEKIKQVKIR